MSPTSPFLAPERDTSASRGRFRSDGGTILYQLPGGIASAVGTGSSHGATNVDFYSPVVVDTPVVVDQFAFELSGTASGQNARIGLYRADKNWQPTGPPLADSGSISLTAAGVKTYTPSTPLPLARGRYLTVMNRDGGSPTFMKVRGIWGAVHTTIASGIVGGMYGSRTYAAFPTPGTAWTDYTGATTLDHVIVMRMSAV